MKLGLKVYKRYFQVQVNHGPREPHLGPEKGKDRSKFRFLDILKIFYCHKIRLREYQFLSVLQTVFTGFTFNLFINLFGTTFRSV